MHRRCFLRQLAVFIAALLLAGCQLYVIGTDDDDDEDSDDGGGSSGLTIRITGSEGGGFEQVVLRIYRIDLERDTGGTTRIDLAEQDLRLFDAPTNQRVLNGQAVPDGSYTRISVFARGDGVSTAGSYADDGLIGGRVPLALPFERADFDVDFTLPRNASREITLVVHTRSALLLDDEEQVFYRFRPAGYAVRSDDDRTGRVEGTLPNTCGNNPEPDDIAVYVYAPEADAGDVLDIQGRSVPEEPVLSFAAASSGAFVSPPLPPGNWRFSWTCRALDDDPERANTQLRDELRERVSAVIEVLGGGERTSLDFAP